jgi:hypothetical protein
MFIARIDEAPMRRIGMSTLALVIGLTAAAPASVPADPASLVGVWKALSFVSEFQDGRPSRAMFGDHPPGYIIFTSEGRMVAVITSEGRKAPATDEDRAALLRTMYAYTGTYRQESDKWTTRVDVAWNPAMDRHRPGAILQAGRRSSDGDVDVAALPQ